MPIFVYHCDCGYRFERLVPRDADAPACPECGSGTRKVPAGTESPSQCRREPGRSRASSGRRSRADPVAGRRQRRTGEDDARGRVPASTRGQGRGWTSYAGWPGPAGAGVRRDVERLDVPRLELTHPGGAPVRIGAVFPQTEIGDDPVLVRDFAQTVEGLGYAHLLVFDHVLGAGLAQRPGWRGAYDAEDPFHEPFVLFGYLAGAHRADRARHRRAHPAAAADRAGRQAGGRGRRAVRGAPAARRRRRLERRRVRGPGGGLRRPGPAHRRADRAAARAVDRAGRRLRRAAGSASPDAGINPLPVQRPIPIWLGGQAEPVLRRVGRDRRRLVPADAPRHARRGDARPAAGLHRRRRARPGAGSASSLGWRSGTAPRRGGRRCRRAHGNSGRPTWPSAREASASPVPSTSPRSSGCTVSC